MEELEAQSKVTTTPVKLALAILAAAVLLNPLLLVRIPKRTEQFGPATVAAKTGISDLSNYFSYALYFAGILLVSAVLFLLRDRLAGNSWNARALRRLIVAILFASLIWRLPFTAPNPTFQSIVSPVVDEFHEGEILGLAPEADAGQDLPVPLLVHGPGMDYAPAWIGAKLAPAGYRIPTIRMFFRFLGSGAVIALVFALIVICKEREDLLSIPDSIRGAFRYWVIGCALAVIIDLSIVGARRFVFWLQISLLILAARALRNEQATRYRIPVFAFLGSALPLGIFYNYSCGISGAAATLAGLSILGWHYGKRGAGLLLTAVASAMATLCALYLICGSREFSAIVRDIEYWSANARRVAFWPVTPASGASIQSVIVMATCCLLLITAVRAFRHFLRFRSNFDESYALALFLIVAVCELRPYLDRADPQHLLLITPTFLFIALYTLLPMAVPRANAIFESIPRPFHESLKWAAVAVFGVLILHTINPLVAFYPNDELPPQSPAVPPDERIVAPEFRLAVQELGAEIETQPCFFALSYSAVWYTVFNRPSCSTFYEPPYARSISAQAQIVDELRRYRPKIVLAEDRSYMKIDGFLPAEICPQVWAYLQKEYVPFKTIGQCQFYRLR